MTLASYLFSLGFYFSAISVSQDIKLRQSIKKYVINESKLIDSIAGTQIEKETTDRVIQIAKETAAEMEKETGVITSLQEADLREYMQEIITEFRNTKMTNSRDEREKES